MDSHRILFATTVASTSDAFLEEVAAGVRERGWSVDLATNMQGAPSRNRPYAEIHDVPWGRGFASPTGSIQAGRVVRRVLVDGQYDLVHTHTPTASAVTRLAAASCRPRPHVVYTAHGFHFGTSSHGPINALVKSIEISLLSLTDTLIVINDEDEAWARSKVRRKTSVLRTRGVGIRDEFMRTATYSGRLRGELKIPEGAYVITTIGELIPRKRQLLAIDAVSEMHGVERHLIIVGDGPLLDPLRRRAHEATARDSTLHVHLIGRRNDVPEILADTDTLLHTSQQEGLPTVVLEAMATGVPVVAFDIRGARELLSGGPGVLVANGSTAAMSVALANLQGDPDSRVSMGLAGRSHAAQFSRRRIAQETCDLYAELIGIAHNATPA